MDVTCSSSTGCPINLSSECVFYEGVALPFTSINTNDDLQTVIQKLNNAIENEGGGSVTGVTASLPLSSSGGDTPNITIALATGSQSGYLSSTNWNTFNNKQDTISLTTVGSSGAATFISNVLNIPQYAISLTTTGTSGAATFVGGVLNIPQYQGSGLAWLLASGGALTANNTISGAFNVGFTNTAIGIGVAPASITASTRLDVRGTGTAGNNAIRVADSANAPTLTHTDAGQFTIYSNTSLSLSVALTGSSTSRITFSNSFGATAIGIHSGAANRIWTSVGLNVAGSTNSITFTSSTSTDTSAPRLGRILGTSGTGGLYYEATTPIGNISRTLHQFSGGLVANGTTLTLTGLYIPTSFDDGGFTGHTVIGIDYTPTITGTGLTHIAARFSSGNILVGGSTITAGSVLVDLQSTTRALLLTRVTNIASVATPVNGMVTYDTTTNLFNFRQNGAWVNITGGTGDVVGPAGATDNAITRYNLATGKLVQNSGVILDDSNNMSSTGKYISTAVFTFQSKGSSDSDEFDVNWYTGSVSNGGTATQGVEIFFSDLGIELEDKSALVEYNVLLTKADGSDNQVKKILVAYRKDGTANPVQTGTAQELFSEGNATPTITFSISGGGLPEINVNDNTSGGWKVKVWAKVSRSN